MMMAQQATKIDCGDVIAVRLIEEAECAGVRRALRANEPLADVQALEAVARVAQEPRSDIWIAAAGWV